MAGKGRTSAGQPRKPKDTSVMSVPGRKGAPTKKSAVTVGGRASTGTRG